jgi:LysM repeat protein
MAQVTLYDASDPGTFVIFPVTPSPQVNDASVKLSWSVARRGGISRPHGRNERTYTFDALLPGWADAYQPYTAYYQHPEDILAQLRDWHAPVAKQGTKLRLVIQREHEVQDQTVYIDTLKATPDVRGGYVVSLGLTEWRTMVVLLDGEQDQATTEGDSNLAESEPAPPDTPDQYAVQDGDTLYDIAASQLGDGERWPEIADLNGIDDPENLQIGTVLQLPSSSPGEADTNDADQES